MKAKSFVDKDIKMLVDALSGKLEPSHKKLKRNLDYPLCDCLTKTPELKYHHRNCKYRLHSEKETLASFLYDVLCYEPVSEKTKELATKLNKEQNEELFRN